MKYKSHSHTKFLDEDAVNFQDLNQQPSKVIAKTTRGKKKNKKKQYAKKNMQTKKKPFKKLYEIEWYDEDKMSWPKHFMERLMHHRMDFDQQSEDEIVQYEVEKGIAELVTEISFQKLFSLQDTRGF